MEEKLLATEESYWKGKRKTLETNFPLLSDEKKLAKECWSPQRVFSNLIQVSILKEEETSASIAFFA